MASNSPICTGSIPAIIAIVILAACSSAPEWRQVDPQRLSRTVTGRVVELSDAPDTTITLELDSTDADALAPGQRVMVCAIPTANRDALEPIIKKLTIGQTVNASGYWVARTRDDGVTEHQLRDTTSLMIVR